MSDANAPEPEVPATPPAAAAPAGPLDAAKDKQMAMWAHLGGIVGILPSLIIWLVFKDRGAKTNVEGKEALNWQITLLIIAIGWAILMGIISGILVTTAISTGNAGLLAASGFLTLIGYLPWIINVVLSIMGGVKVNGGGSYRYPVNFRFIK